MEFFFAIYHNFLYQPVFNALVLLYQSIPGSDFGVSIIVLTVLFRFLFYPLSAKGIIAQKKLTELQPKVKEIQEKFRHDKNKQATETLELYKREKVNPLAGLSPILIQLPILITLYQVFWKGFDPEQLSYLYSFISNPGTINAVFLGFLNLKDPSFALAAIAGVFQFLQLRQMQPKKKPASSKDGKPDIAASFQKQMMYLFPLILVFIISRLPSAVGLYILTTTVFSIVQQWYVARKSKSQA